MDALIFWLLIHCTTVQASSILFYMTLGNIHFGIKYFLFSFFSRDRVCNLNSLVKTENSGALISLSNICYFPPKVKYLDSVESSLQKRQSLTIRYKALLYTKSDHWSTHVSAAYLMAGSSPGFQEVLHIIYSLILLTEDTGN